VKQHQTLFCPVCASDDKAQPVNRPMTAIQITPGGMHAGLGPKPKLPTSDEEHFNEPHVRYECPFRECGYAEIHRKLIPIDDRDDRRPRS
jgi:hypothetical protein